MYCKCEKIGLYKVRAQLYGEKEDFGNIKRKKRNKGLSIYCEIEFVVGSLTC